MAAPQQQRKNGLSLFVVLFLISLAIPLIMQVGTLRLSVYRVFLLLIFVPAVIVFMQGKAGRFRLIDGLVIFYCFWASLSFSVVHGFVEYIETIGIFWVETLGTYLLARCFIRTPEHFLGFIRIMFWLCLIMTPFAVVELTTARNLALEIFNAVGSVYVDIYKDPRWGLDRVQGPFEHPILMGVFFGAFIGPFFFVLGYHRGFILRYGRTLWITVVGGSALSSGPLAGMTAQLLFIGWATILAKVKNRWYIFAGLVVLALIIVDMLSNRSPFAVFISYFAFNASTAYNRIHIFNWGMINIANNPIFGLGLNEWERYFFMSTSFDMYWLISGLRHGIPALIVHSLIFLITFFSVVYRSFSSDRLRAYRLGYICGLFGLFLSGWTVHFWNATYVLFFFFLASGMWMLDYEENDTAEGSADPSPGQARKSVYTRFPAKPPVINRP